MEVGPTQAGLGKARLRSTGRGEGGGGGVQGMSRAATQPLSGFNSKSHMSRQPQVTWVRTDAPCGGGRLTSTASALLRAGP